jgi:hypothetical protein
LKYDSGLKTGHARSRSLLFRVGLFIEQDPLLWLCEDLLNQSSVKRMSGSVGYDMTDKGHPKERKVADKVEDLVANKLVEEPQARFIHDTVFGQHDGIVQ